MMHKRWQNLMCVHTLQSETGFWSLLPHVVIGSTVPDYYISTDRKTGLHPGDMDPFMLDKHADILNWR